jgi:hypothetical protein
METKKICSGCGADLGVIEIEPIKGFEDAVSHGLCDCCSLRLYGAELVAQISK